MVSTGATWADRDDLPVIDVADPAFWVDPSAALSRVRAAAPAARTATGELVLLRYQDVQDALRHPELRTFAVEALLQGNGVTSGPLHEWCQLLMLNTDPPEHTRLRRLVGRAFTPRQVEAIRPRVRAQAAGLLAAQRIEGGAECRLEWVGDLAHELPIWVICELIGVPAADRHLFKQWTVDVGLVFANVVTDEQRQVATDALTSLFGYVRELIAERRRSPGDDLLSGLIQAEEAGDRLSTLELEAMVANLLNGGHETTRALLTIAVVVLARHPDQFARLQAQPELVPGAVEELLRYEAPIVSTLRRAHVDVEVGGARVQAGEVVITSFLAANRDPDRFEQPDAFDVTRTDVRPVSFGSGIHHCIGAALARLEAQEVVAELAASYRSLELRAEPVWEPFFQVRRMESVPVTMQAMTAGVLVDDGSGRPGPERSTR